MKKLLALLLLLSIASFPQSLSTAGSSTSSTGSITAAGATCATTNACIAIHLYTTATNVAVVLSGAFTATIVVEKSADNGATWTNVDTLSTAGTTSYGATAFTDFRARASAYTSGTIVVVLNSGGGSSGSGGSGSGTVSANNTSVGSVANYPAAGGSTTLGPTTLVWSPNSLTLGVAAGGNAVLGLPGSTSGTATFTAPAVAGTITNGVTMTNALLGPVGSATNPTYSFTGFAGAGLSGASGTTTLTSTTNQLNFTINGTTLTQFFSNVETRLGSGGILGFSSAAALGASQDTSLTRSAAGVLAIGGGSAGDTTAKVKAAGYMSVGTTFTSNAGCTDSSLTGGATAGTFVSGATGTCTTILTMGNTATAPNGWACDVVDRTTTAAVWRQTAANATTATIQATSGAVAADVIQFKCLGY